MTRTLPLMDRALHPDPVKRSPVDDTADLTKAGPLQHWAKGEKTRAADRWLTVHVAAVSGDIASAVVHSPPHRKYLRLIKTPDGWKILDALWLPR